MELLAFGLYMNLLTKAGFCKADEDLLLKIKEYLSLKQSRGKPFKKRRLKELRNSFLKVLKALIG